MNENYMLDMEEVNTFLTLKEKAASKIAFGTSLCILSPIPVILLGGFSEQFSKPIENLAGILGVIILLIMVAEAVYNFITANNSLKTFSYQQYDLTYETKRTVQDMKDNYQSTYSRNIAIGTVLCIVSIIPLLISGVINIEFLIITSIGILLTIVSIAVYLFVHSSMIMNSYKQVLQEEEFEVRESKKNDEKSKAIESIYWSLATALYLGWSFLTGDWGRSWILWPIAGVLYSVYYNVMKLLVRE